ncbi:MAG: helix-turn-helix transcriptional regulator [Verrucomicrobia bacterium]|nr:helix-turn-helix transcriptional regulator [Verrucomicrobiota bacterium]
MQAIHIAVDRDRCAVEITLAVIGGKYKPLLLYYLQEDGVLRFGELRRIVSDASKKMLTQQLRELERDGLVLRRVYQQVPPKVEYSLTERGRGLQSVLKEMGLWGKQNAKYYNAKIAPKRTGTSGNAENATCSYNASRNSQIF